MGHLCTSSDKVFVMTKCECRKSGNHDLWKLRRTSQLPSPFRRESPASAHRSPATPTLTCDAAALNRYHITHIIMAVSFASLVGGRTDLASFLPELVFCNMLGAS